MKEDRNIQSIIKYLNKYGITIKESNEAIPNDVIYVKNSESDEGFYMPKDFNIFYDDYATLSATTNYSYQVKNRMSNDTTYHTIKQRDMFDISAKLAPAS